MADTHRAGPPATEVDAPLVHAAVDRVVLAHGAYLPVELLLDQGRLEYRDYESWRTGSVDFLEDVLLGNPERIRALLDAAAAWAGELGLEARVEVPEGWGARAGTPLACARQSPFEHLLRTVYRRREDLVQPDLFLDAGDALLVANLRAALVARDAEHAAERLDELLRRAPEHRLRPAAERLCDALAHLASGAPAGDPELELERLSGPLAADAQELLGARARDYAAPFWRRLAGALAGQPFDASVPELHATHALRQCLDWGAIRDRVLATPDFEAEPVLLARLAEAERRLGERVAAIGRLAILCWRWPDAAEMLLDEEGLADAAVQRAWEDFRNLDTDPPLDATWLPTWLLLAEPGLAGALEVQPPEPAVPPGESFFVLRELTRRRDVELDDAAIDLRRRLRDAHPALLAEYLRRRG